MTNNPISKETSIQLAWLKLFSCIGVVYVHAYFIHYGFFTITPEKLPVVYYIQTLISQYFFRVTLPIFFAVSGFIYTAKNYQDTIWQFMKRKARGLLVPYLIWNSVGIAYIFLAQQFDFTRKCFTGHMIISNFDWARWIFSYAGLGNEWMPFVYPLWFLPYLFAAFMIAHLMRSLLGKYLWLVLLLAVTNIICLSYIPLLSIVQHWGPFLRLLYAMSFFSLGSWIVKNKELIESNAIMISSGILFAAVIALDMLNVIHNVKWLPLSLYVGTVFMFSSSRLILRCGERIKKAINFLTGHSFLIYVNHEYALTAMIMLIYPALPGKTLYLAPMYFLIPTVLVTALVTGGYILQKFFPKVYRFLF